MFDIKIPVIFLEYFLVLKDACLFDFIPVFSPFLKV